MNLDICTGRVITFLLKIQFIFNLYVCQIHNNFNIFTYIDKHYKYINWVVRKFNKLPALKAGKEQNTLHKFVILASDNGYLTGLENLSDRIYSTDEE